jgi:hypothetical protein
VRREWAAIDSRDVASGVAMSDEHVLDVIVRKQLKQCGIYISAPDPNRARRPVAT